jgi:plastocyanin
VHAASVHARNGDSEVMITMRPLSDLHRRAFSRAAVTALAAIALTAIVACVSDRSTVTGVDASACSVQLPVTAFGSAVVVIRNFTFSPAQVHVAAGQKVTWVNCEAPASDSHTSTADAGKWASPILAPGAVFTTDFTNAGTFSYHCEIHPGMTGSVVVE